MTQSELSLGGLSLRRAMELQVVQSLSRKLCLRRKSASARLMLFMSNTHRCQGTLELSSWTPLRHLRALHTVNSCITPRTCPEWQQAFFRTLKAAMEGRDTPPISSPLSDQQHCLGPPDSHKCRSHTTHTQNVFLLPTLHLPSSNLNPLPSPCYSHLTNKPSILAPLSAERPQCGVPRDFSPG